MADPTLAEVKTQWDNLVLLLDSWKNAAGVTATTNVLSRLDVIEQAAEGNFLDEQAAALAAFRANFAAAGETAAAVLSPVIKEYGRLSVVNAPESDPLGILQRIYRYLSDNSITIQSRVFVFGSVAAGGSNVGTGTVNRLTKDMDNFDIENTTADIKTILCTADARSGAQQHQETFEIRGGNAEKDRMKITGSGRVGSLTNLSARSSLDFGIQNPSFDDALTTTAIPSWTIAGGPVIGDFSLDTTNYYRSYFGAGTPASLVWANTTGTLTQLFSTNNLTINPNVPLYAQVAYQAALGTAVGTLALQLGDQSTSVSVTGAVGWNVLKLAVGQKNWFKLWNSADPGIVLTFTRTSGTLRIDDLVVSPFQFFDGLWYAPVGGATPALLNDSFTFTDTETGAKRQYWLWRAFGAYLPHSGTPNWADP